MLKEALIELKLALIGIDKLKQDPPKWPNWSRRLQNSSKRLSVGIVFDIEFPLH